MAVTGTLAPTAPFVDPTVHPGEWRVGEVDGVRAFAHSSYAPDADHDGYRLLHVATGGQLFVTLPVSAPLTEARELARRFAAMLAGDGEPATEPAPRNMHDLKVWPEFFRPIASGEKLFDVRRDDRGFRAGDVLQLREWSRSDGYTGQQLLRTVTYVLAGEPFGIKPGFVVLGFADPRVAQLEERVATAERGVETWREKCQQAHRDRVTLKYATVPSTIDDARLACIVRRAAVLRRDTIEPWAAQVSADIDALLVELAGADPRINPLLTRYGTQPRTPVRAPSGPPCEEG